MSLAFILLALLSGSVRHSAHAQTETAIDSSAFARMDGMLSEYVHAIEGLAQEEKSAECDFIISSCTDSTLKAHVTGWLMKYYSDSRLMGEEGVAVDIYDHWIASDKAALPAQEKREAEVFVMFNRESLVGAQAPQLTLLDADGQTIEVPGRQDRQTVLFFYDTDCAKCKVESILLDAWLSETSTPLTVFAIYTGRDRNAWDKYTGERFSCTNDKVEIRHCWDPEMESDFVRHYGVLGTPRIFAIDEHGIIRGRRLTAEALKQVVALGVIRSELYARAPIGSRIADITVHGNLTDRKGSTEGIYRIDRLGGKRNYIVFYTPSCNNCKEQLAAVRNALGKRERALFVNVDDIVAADGALAAELFDTFDLSVMPHIILTDRRGRILDKYLSL